MTPPDRVSIDVPALQTWLMTVPHRDDGGAGFMRDLVERFDAAGLGLWRISYALMTKHPEVLWTPTSTRWPPRVFTLRALQPA